MYSSNSTQNGTHGSGYNRLAYIIVYTYIAPCIIVFGLYGNTIALILLCRLRKKSGYIFFLTCLTVSDLLFMLTSLPGLIVNNIQLYKPKIIESLTIRVYGIERISDFAVQICVLTTLLLVVERTIAIWKPLKSKIWCTTNKRCVLIVLIYCVSVTISLILHFVFSKGFPNVNKTSSMSKYQDMAENTKVAFMFVILWILLTQVPVLLIAMFNFCTIALLRRRTSRNLSISNNSVKEGRMKEQKITFTLILITSMFLFWHLPMNIYLLLSWAMNVGGEQYDIAFLIMTPLGLCNSAFNFIIFVARSKTFKRLFFKTLRCK